MRDVSFARSAFQPGDSPALWVQSIKANAVRSWLMSASRNASTGTAIRATVGSRDTDFRDQAPRRFFEGQRVTAFHGFARQASWRLTLLGRAETLRDLAALRSNGLEALRGNRAGEHSIRINTRWRICFRWTDNGPCDVEIVDYHQGRVP